MSISPPGCIEMRRSNCTSSAYGSAFGRYYRTPRLGPAGSRANDCYEAVPMLMRRGPYSAIWTRPHGRFEADGTNPHVIGADGQESHSAATENVRHHEGGRKQLFSPHTGPALLPSEPISGSHLCVLRERPVQTLRQHTPGVTRRAVAGGRVRLPVPRCRFCPRICVGRVWRWRESNPLNRP